MIIGIGSVAILVNDAKKSARWYRDKLGFDASGNVKLNLPRLGSLVIFIIATGVLAVRLRKPAP